MVVFDATTLLYYNIVRRPMRWIESRCYIPVNVRIRPIHEARHMAVFDRSRIFK